MEKADFQELSGFFGKFRKLHYKKGEVILRPDEIPRGIFYLEKGFARVYAISSEGIELTLIIFKEGDIFPIVWALNNSVNNYYVEALTPLEVRCAPKIDFLIYLKSNPEILFEITGRVLTRFSGILTRMEYLVFGNAYNKVVSIIVICAERFGEKMGEQIMIQFPFTHRLVANLAGISRETASLELKKLERAGLISYKGKHLIVQDLKELKKESRHFF